MRLPGVFSFLENGRENLKVNVVPVLESKAL